jgi:hypothetical protein
VTRHIAPAMPPLVPRHGGRSRIGLQQVLYDQKVT